LIEGAFTAKEIRNGEHKIQDTNLLIRKLWLTKSFVGTLFYNGFYKQVTSSNTQSDG